MDMNIKLTEKAKQMVLKHTKRWTGCLLGSFGGVCDS